MCITMSVLVSSYELLPYACVCVCVCVCVCAMQVKILVNKPGTGMAHLDNPQGAKNAIHHLHGHKLMGSTLELKSVLFV